MSHLKYERFLQLSNENMFEFYNLFIQANNHCIKCLKYAMKYPSSRDAIIILVGAYKNLETVTGEQLLWQISPFLKYAASLQSM